MRLLVPTAAATLLAACASGPRPPAPVTPAPPITQQRPSGTLIGLSVQELGARLGAPTFQVREGPGLKLQWANSTCVLDAYLYAPSANGVMRVTHIDTRRVSGDAYPQASCIAALDVTRP